MKKFRPYIEVSEFNDKVEFRVIVNNPPPNSKKLYLQPAGRMLRQGPSFYSWVPYVFSATKIKRWFVNPVVQRNKALNKAKKLLEKISFIPEKPSIHIYGGRE